MSTTSLWSFLCWRVAREPCSRIRAQADHLQQALDGGASLDELLPAEHGAFLDRYRIAVAQAFKHGNVVLTPVRLASEGGHVIGLDDYRVSLGVPLSEVRPMRKHTKTAAARSAASLAALADPTRLRILVTLIQWPRTAEELADTLSLYRSSISEHLSALRDLGLVAGVRGRRPEVHHADADALRAYLGGIADELIEAAHAQLFREQS